MKISSTARINARQFGRLLYLEYCAPQSGMTAAQFLRIAGIYASSQADTSDQLPELRAEVCNQFDSSQSEASA